MGDESDVDDILTDLLSNSYTEENDQPIPKRTLKELDYNFLDKEEVIANDNKESKAETNVSEIYDDKLDSSDDEDKRYFEEQKYSESGRDLKQLLKRQSIENNECSVSRLSLSELSTKKNEPTTSNVKTTINNKVSSKHSVSSNAVSAVKDVYCDPIFGLRIINPLVSSTELKNRMVGRTAVSVSKVKYHVTTGNINDDWVIAGVLIKTDTRKSQKGSTYCIWKISDLSDNMKTVSIFLFSGAYKSFWKTIVGTVVGILNPNVLESRDNVNEATLSCDNAQKIMILGKSKDMGTCKSKKKNGEPCTAIVNINRCEYCIYHVKQEYNKCSRRAELQSSSSGQKFSLDSKKNKANMPRPMLPGMQPFVPVYAKRNNKLHAKDCERLALLSGSTSTKAASGDSSENNIGLKKGVAVELTNNQMKKDYERLTKLRGWKGASPVTAETFKTVESSFNSTSAKLPPSSPQTAGKSLCSSPSTSFTLSKLSSTVTTRKSTSSLRLKISAIPRLGAGCVGDEIDFSQPITKIHVDMAKMNAIKWVQEKGKIKPTDPNKIRLDKAERIERGTKRQREAEEEEQQIAKKSNIAEKFKELLKAKSAHVDLIEKSYENEKEKYFNKLEIKEKMEEKMMTTFKVDCKAVKCITCKYIAFSASDLCKEQNHPIRVINAIKRFFKCADCGNRTVSLDRMPSHSCKKCNSSNWTRAAMMDEKKTVLVGATLSVRGGEEKFLGSAIKDANLNLLVPETD